jgi:hypothetical protein
MACILKEIWNVMKGIVKWAIIIAVILLVLMCFVLGQGLSAIF